MNSEYFSDSKINHLASEAVPLQEMRNAGLDIAGGDQKIIDICTQIMPKVLEYDDREDRYWQYGEKRLYEQFRLSDEILGRAGPSWGDLHQFVANYAWVEGRWRFILDKPCWPLHSDVVDRVVMLYEGRKYYEEHRGKASPKEHVEFLGLMEIVVRDVEELLSHCELKEAKMSEVDQERTYIYMRHSLDASVRNWVPMFLHRVREWEEAQLPDSPSVNVTPVSKPNESVKRRGGRKGASFGENPTEPEPPA